MESAWKRALKDTRHNMLDTVWYQVLAVILLAISSIVVAYSLPEGMSSKIQALWAAIGGLGSVAILVTLVLLWNLFRAPYRQRNEGRVETAMLKQHLEELTTIRLELVHEEVGEANSDNHTIWNHLIVKNTSATLAKGCFGQLVSFSGSSNVWGNPPTSVRYSWTTNRGGDNCRTSDIGPGCWDYLDILVVYGGKLYTPVLQKDNRTKQLLYPLPPGQYGIEVMVGSEAESFPPSNIRLLVEYKGGLDLHVQKV